MKVSININRFYTCLIFALVIFALIKPNSLSYIGLAWLDTLLIIIDGISLLLLSIEYILKRYRLSTSTKCVVGVFGALTISTIMYSNDYFTLLKIVGPAIAACMFTDYAMQKKPLEYIESSFYLLCILYVLNLITIFMFYPMGMYTLDYVEGDTYLMGFDNNMIYHFIPLCCYAAIYSYIKKGVILERSCVFAIVLMLVSEFYVKTATGIIQSVLITLLFIQMHTKIIKYMMRPQNVFLFFFIASISLTVFRIQNYFENFIVGVLNKDISFTGRTYLWDFALSKINENIYLGSGASERSIEGITGTLYPHPHSLLLDLLTKGGLMMLVVFIILCIVFYRKYKRANSNIIKKVILTTLFVFLIGETINSTQYKIFFWTLFVLIEYAEQLEKIRI